jgi:hypothetical protein
VTDVPAEVRRLAEERDRARTARDFGLADELRRQIRERGFEVTDTSQGSVLGPRAEPATTTRHLEPHEVESVLGEPAAFAASFQWLAEGWPEDIVRSIDSFRRRGGGRNEQYVVVDVAGTDPTIWPDDVEVIRLQPGAGWGVARNAGLRRAAGSLVVLVDGSVEAEGDVLGPLGDALRDPSVGLTGPFGIVSRDLHEFEESDGPEVDAIEAYLMAFRRDLVQAGLAFDDRFRFYRSADIEFSFQVKARGLRATVTGVPVRRHEHRMWASTPPEERARLSKRNYYRFLDRWRGRTDLLVGRPD